MQKKLGMDRQRWLAARPYVDIALDLPQEQLPAWLEELDACRFQPGRLAIEDDPVHEHDVSGRQIYEVYLLFAEGRADIFPAGDLAVQIEVGRILGLPDRPTEKQVRELAEPWRPHRGAAAIFAWHHRRVVPV